MARKIRVILYGLGSIGAGIVRVLAARPDFSIVGAVDLDPGKVGFDVADVVGLSRPIDVIVSNDAARVLRRSYGRRATY